MLGLRSSSSARSGQLADGPQTLFHLDESRPGCRGTRGRCPSARRSRRPTCPPSWRSGDTTPARRWASTPAWRISSSAGLLGGAPQVLCRRSRNRNCPPPARAGLLERLLERPADGHRLADALHLRGQRRVGLGKFLEGEPRHLGDHVVDRRLEAGLGLPRVMSLGNSCSR